MTTMETIEMTHEEYMKQLNELRKQYANEIRRIVRKYKDSYVVIARSESACKTYRIRVNHLMRDYISSWD